ncbi:YjfI family protein [Caulobacter sp. SL161]|uniref:YjfI family protein n=1 Tax=Caulobacter sp. SL161 TaxID=2995156 RepID=UPI00227319F3|nr:YjfI family protein [Caulobacter sp. SL161]MCY1648389.1 YjfI family protein [Caulobacter sp. SL161]
MPAKLKRSAQAAERTRAWREARRNAGFVKIEVWAPAACKPDILSAVQAIVVESVRGPALQTNPNPPKGVRHMDSVIDTAWTIHTLRDALVESALVREDEMTVTVVEGVEPVLMVVMHEFGDLPIYVSGGGLQLVVSTLLWACDEQNNRAEFNEFLLKAQKIVPLSNFGITTVDGRDYYELMGEISSKTTLQTLVIELRTLADNAIAAASDLRDSFEKSRVAAA